MDYTTARVSKTSWIGTSWKLLGPCPYKSQVLRYLFEDSIGFSYHLQLSPCSDFFCKRWKFIIRGSQGTCRVTCWKNHPPLSRTSPTGVLHPQGLTKFWQVTSDAALADSSSALALFPTRTMPIEISVRHSHTFIKSLRRFRIFGHLLQNRGETIQNANVFWVFLPNLSFLPRNWFLRNLLTFIIYPYILSQKKATSLTSHFPISPLLCHVRASQSWLLHQQLGDTLDPPAVFNKAKKCCNQKSGTLRLWVKHGKNINDIVISFGSCKVHLAIGLQLFHGLHLAYVFRMIGQVWGNRDMSSIMCATRSNKIQRDVASIGGLLKVFLFHIPGNCGNIYTQYTSANLIYIYTKKWTAWLPWAMSHRDSAKTARPTLQRC